jgi:hypothetical protein
MVVTLREALLIIILTITTAASVLVLMGYQREG